MPRFDGIDDLTSTLDMNVALRRPGYATIRRKAKNWGEVNALVITTAGKRDYPAGTVLTVDDWTGRDQFMLRGGQTAPPRMVKLSGAIHGLPENPAMPASVPAWPSFDRGNSR